MPVALEEDEWSEARPGRTLPPKNTRYPFYRRMGGRQGRSGQAKNIVLTGIFCIHPCLLSYYCYIPIYTLSNLPRIRRIGRSFCNLYHTLTVLPHHIITHTEALETVLSLSLYAPVVATCYCCVPYVFSLNI